MPLIAHYPLHEDSGSTAHDVRGGNHGTTNGGVSQGANGILGTTAYSLDGADDYVSTTNIVDGWPRVSITAWVRKSGWSTDYENVASDASSSTGQNKVEIQRDQSNNRLRFNPSGGNQENIVTATTDIADDEWHFVAGTYDADGLSRIYVDAIIEGETAANGAAVGGGGAMGIGGDADVRGLWAGRIADVRIYDHALTPAEVQYLRSVSQSASALSEVRTL